MLLEIIISLLAPFLLYVIYDYGRHLFSLRHYPPGPFPWPLIGNLNILKENPHKVLKELSRKYGDVFSFSVVHQRFVAVCDIGSARTALVKNGEKISGRIQDNYVSYLVTRNSKDLVTAEGEKWKLLRKLTHSSFQMYGYGMEKLEETIVIESQHLHQRLRDLDGTAIDPKVQMALVFMNITCAILFGVRYELEDQDFKDVIEFQDLITLAYSVSELVSYFPSLRFLPIFKSVDYAKRAISLGDPILERKIKEHQDTYNPEDIRDFTDALIKFSAEIKANGGAVSDDDIPMILQDFIFAGVDTGLNTIGFGIQYLIHWPQYQDKAYAEMKNVLGNRSYPTLKDRSRLPLLDAIMMEVLRMSCVGILGIPHRSLEKVDIGGYHILEDTKILFNHWAINYDERHWDQPHEFIPERWFDDDGTVISPVKKSYLTFGTGRRNCVGEALGKAELFLLLGRLLVDFRFKLAPGERLPSLEGQANFTLEPKPCLMRFRYRHENL